MAITVCSDLPPAGNPILWQRDAAGMPQFPGYRALWVSSGTAALALAIIAARARQPAIAEPEVIVPGYACPDLVAAVQFAGARAVLADIGADDPGYDLNSLVAALSPRTIAVVAVNFLGVGERLAAIRAALAATSAVALIEDNAQWFPEPATALRGDYICLSFGRGKPVSLLGGGALLISDALAAELPAALPIESAVAAGAGYRAKILAYNLLLKPYWYGLISRNPLLKLGQTVFKPLAAIRALDDTRQRLLAANVRAHLQRARAPEQRLRALFANNPLLLDFAALAPERCGRLLRYPILCSDGAQRENLLVRLREAGLGATSMYQKILPEIPGVAGRVEVRTNLTNAQIFARRLLTLPTHAGVTEQHLRRYEKIFAA